MLNRGKWLVIAPHADDEVLGLGPLLARPGNLCVHLIAARSGQTREWAKVSTNQVLRAVSHAYQINGPLEGCEAHKLGAYKAEVADAIRGAVLTEGPAALFIPAADSLHQDHRLVYHAAIAALRPWKIGRTLDVYAYRALSDCPPKMGNTVVQVSEDAVAKAGRAFSEVYADQARNFARSAATIERWAATCGAWIGKPYGWSLDYVQGAEYL